MRSKKIYVGISITLILLSLIFSYRMATGSLQEKSSLAGLLLIAFLVGLFLPIWTFKDILIKDKVRIALIATISFLIGYFLFAFSYGLNAIFILPLFAPLNVIFRPDSVHGFSDQQMILTAIVYAVIGLYIIILKYKKTGGRK